MVPLEGYIVSSGCGLSRFREHCASSRRRGCERMSLHGLPLQGDVGCGGLAGSHHQLDVCVRGRRLMGDFISLLLSIF